jgi:hypothetical protein
MSLHYIDEDGNLRNKNNKRKKISNSLLKKYGITNILISEWFGYRTPDSFNSSKAKKDMINGIIEVIKQVENESTHGIK